MLLIKNLTKAKIDEKFLRLVAGKALKKLPELAKNTKKIEIDLVIIGEKRTRSLNRIWRGKNKVTDVLSFGNPKPLRLRSGQAKIKSQKFRFIIPPDDIINLGQIFICASVAAKQAKKYGFSFREEMARLLVHGILHLAGYDHEKSEKEEKQMMNLQEKILEKTK